MKFSVVPEGGWSGQPKYKTEFSFFDCRYQAVNRALLV